MILSSAKPVTMVNLTKNLLNNTRVVVVANNSTEAIIQMPEKPTRPLTPYFKFLKDTRPKITGSSESFQHSQDVVKKVAYMWQNLDGVEKARYEQDYADEKAEYDQKFKCYKEQLTPEQRVALERGKDNGSKKKKEIERKRQSKELGKPKRKPSAFFLFLKDQKSARPQTIKITEWTSLVAKKWQSLNDIEKRAYMEESGKYKEEYERQLLEWEGKMIADGNNLVVRQSTKQNMLANQGVLNVNQY